MSSGLMTDPRLVTAFTETLAEHRSWRSNGKTLTCACQALLGEYQSPGKADAALEAHQAEQLANRLEQVGWHNDRIGLHATVTSGAHVHDYECYATDVPVFRLADKEGHE